LPLLATDSYRSLPTTILQVSADSYRYSPAIAETTNFEITKQLGQFERSREPLSAIVNQPTTIN
jgi:hypothetical protein